MGGCAVGLGGVEGPASATSTSGERTGLEGRTSACHGKAGATPNRSVFVLAATPKEGSSRSSISGEYVSTSCIQCEELPTTWLYLLASGVEGSDIAACAARPSFEIEGTTGLEVLPTRWPGFG